MKKYEYALSLTSQFYYCSYPLRLDTSNYCSYNCSYCFMNSRGGKYNNNQIKQFADPVYIDNQLKKSMSGDIKTLTREFLYKKIPIHFGGVSDPFSECRTTQKVTLELMKILNKYQYPTIVSTRCSSIDSNIFKLITDGKYVVQVSMPANSKSNLKKLFHDHNAYIKQIKMIEELKSKSISVICRLQPIFPNYENVYIEMIDELSTCGIDCFVIEYYKLPYEKRETLNQLNEILGYNIFEYYKVKQARPAGREWILPPSYKLELLNQISNSIEKKRALFFIFADNDLLHLNKNSCCIGPYAKDGFENSYKYTIPNAITKSNKTNIVQFDSISDEWHPKGSLNRILNSKSRLKGRNITVKDYLLKAWNSSNHLSPSFYYGISSTGNRDNNGNIIFRNRLV